MKVEPIVRSSVKERSCAWGVHAFTASGAALGVVSLLWIHQGHIHQALWLMVIAVAIDAVDGFFARRYRVKEVLPDFDGALLDNILDFTTYAVIPAYLAVVMNLFPPPLAILAACLIVLSSSYQFAQGDAKTADNFFKGFPSYWNIVVFHLLLLGLSPEANFYWILFFAVMVFVPIKFLYPSRPEYISKSKIVTEVILTLTFLWALLIPLMVAFYPDVPSPLVTASLSYIALYWGYSVYRTLKAV